jgi:uncharacterized protein YehS (DUF1456 family)
MIGFSRGCLAQILNARGRRNFRHAADKFIRQYSRARASRHCQQRTRKTPFKIFIEK